MQPERKKILWLVSWYPNKYDLFDGDFIQRHAKAAALHDDVHVLFVKQHEAQPAEEVELKEQDGLTEQIIYLPLRKGLVARISNYRQWLYTYKKQVTQLIEKQRPQLVHVHIPWKVGLIGLWAKKRFGIPYLVTEHWGIYNTTVSDNIYTRSFLTQHLLKRIFREAKAFSTVSNFLGEGVNKSLVDKKYIVIPNVVDTMAFRPGGKKFSRFTFLHVSNMVPLKNVEGILQAFQLALQQTSTDLQLVFVGNRDLHYPALAERLGLLNKSVFFRGEIPYGQVAAEMQQSHVLVLNSDMENAPCVIGEALCCGLPVIATAVGGIPELLSENNGMLILPRDVDALSKAMVKTVKEYHRFQHAAIAAAAQERFSFSTIGQQFRGLYST